MKLSYPGINPEISAWKGQEIFDFQEDLLAKVDGRLSEKWFYTHMKSANASLPRIDVLNMLSKYAGYGNWDDFRFKNSKTPALNQPMFSARKSNRIFIIIPGTLILIVIMLLALYKLTNTQNYRFNFIDANTMERIVNNNIRVELLQPGESPVTYRSDKDGIVVIKTNESKIKMIIHAPYYLPDTLQRILKKFNRNEEVRLRADDYALMIHYFSQSDVKAWQNRREQLDKMLSDDAMIYQVADQKLGTGMELLNKQEFIDKLTMPSSGLKQIEVLDSKYENGRIAILRFKVKSNR